MTYALSARERVPLARAPSGQLRGPEPVGAAREVEGLWHAGSLDAPIAVWSLAVAIWDLRHVYGQTTRGGTYA